MTYVDIYPRHAFVRVDLGGATFQLHLQLMNLTPFELELDRASFHFWCGGVRLDATFLKKQKIASGASESLFRFWIYPDGAADQNALVFRGNQVTLDGNIEFNCRARSFAKGVGSFAVAEPKRKEEHEVLGPRDVLLRWLQ